MHESSTRIRRGRHPFYINMWRHNSIFVLLLERPLPYVAYALRPSSMKSSLSGDCYISMHDDDKMSECIQSLRAGASFENGVRVRLVTFEDVTSTA